jgi:hypothetical protein
MTSRRSNPPKLLALLALLGTLGLSTRTAIGRSLEQRLAGESRPKRL